METRWLPKVRSSESTLRLVCTGAGGACSSQRLVVLAAKAASPPASPPCAMWRGARAQGRPA